MSHGETCDLCGVDRAIPEERDDGVAGYRCGQCGGWFAAEPETDGLELRRAVAVEVMGLVRGGLAYEAFDKMDANLHENKLLADELAVAVGWARDGLKFYGPLPAYESSIAAAWEVEERVADLDLVEEYEQALIKEVADEPRAMPWPLIHASPAQRSRAALAAVRQEVKAE